MRGSLLREPIHPPSTHFPMALFPMAVVFDLLALARQDGALYTRAAFIVMVAAMAMAGIAIITGFIHLIRDVSPTSRAWRVALIHMTVQLSATSVLLISILLRLGHVDATRPPALAMIAALAGVILMLCGGWIGGRLVYAYGVGVQSKTADSDCRSSDAAQ